MGGSDEVAELHRLSGRALVALFGEAPGAEIRLADGCALGLSGERVADLNMLLLGAPAAEAEAFLDEAMARAEARGLDLLAMMTPAVAQALAGPAERHGLIRAGEVPLMVLRGSAEVRLGRTCRIEEARDSATARIAGDLAAAAFDLPRDAVGRVLDPLITPTSTASVYVAFAGDEPMSSVTVTRTGDTAGIWTMATPPAHQGKGMGRALLSRIIERLRHEGVGRFYLFATAAGFPLYTSLGFVTLAEDAAWVKGSSTQTHGWA
ncbi:MAG TPA: GNAT family N-acetyltransferase [Caulobacteraceae bacterium]|jgi:GNAT superfamily N-acetyltransferase|nr:GNAT family N-acetyltransferase [Caulobacteraceae bacterium]